MTCTGGRLGFCSPASRLPGSLVGVKSEGPFGSDPSVMLVLLVSVCVYYTLRVTGTGSGTGGTGLHTVVGSTPPGCLIIYTPRWRWPTFFASTCPPQSSPEDFSYITQHSSAKEQF